MSQLTVKEQIYGASVHKKYYFQWQKVTKYIYSSSVLKCSIEILVYYLSIFILCYFVLLLHQVSAGNTALFTFQLKI